jgi:U3 small nucleolar RNA-associated protein 18
VYKWDMRMRRCVHRHVDEGSLGARTLDVSADGKYYALGHESGVVNVYDSVVAGQSKTPTPMRVVMNLTTPIDQGE